MTFVKIYADESGTHKDAAVLTVAAYAARPTDWQLFAKDWNRIMRPTGLTHYHATDAQALEGEFRGWGADKRDDLVRQLLPILPRHAAGFAVSLHMKEFDKALRGREHLRPLLGNPYGACFQWLVDKIIAHTHDARARFAFVHEINEWKAEAMRAFEYLKEKPRGELLTTLSFGAKTDLPPLSAADILAYECGKRIANPAGVGRKPWAALNPPSNRVALAYFGPDNMGRLIAILERADANRDKILKRSSSHGQSL